MALKEKELPKQQKNERYATIKRYSQLCGTTVHAIHNRIKLSDQGKIKEGSESYLEQFLLEEIVDLPLIDLAAYPPKRLMPGRKKKKV